MFSPFFPSTSLCSGGRCEGTCFTRGGGSAFAMSSGGSGDCPVELRPKPKPSVSRSGCGAVPPPPHTNPPHTNPSRGVGEELNPGTRGMELHGMGTVRETLPSAKARSCRSALSTSAARPSSTTRTPSPSGTT